MTKEKREHLDHWPIASVQFYGFGFARRDAIDAMGNDQPPPVEADVIP